MYRPQGLSRMGVLPGSFSGSDFVDACRHELVQTRKQSRVQGRGVDVVGS